MLALVLCGSFDSPGLMEGRDLFGVSVAALDDVDGDGIPDFAVGQPCFTSKEHERGRVWIVSSKGGRAIREVVAPSDRQGFGWTLAAIGDVDGDGYADLAVGIADWSQRSEPVEDRVVIVSARDACILGRVPASTGRMLDGWDCFGATPVVCGIGDWDRDGVADFAVGSPSSFETSGRRGRVDVYSGRGLVLMRQLFGAPYTLGFGQRLCAIGDVDGDGASELAVSTVAFDGSARAGEVTIVSSRDARVLRRMRAGDGSRTFGLALASAGDLDVDGVPDLWIGEPYLDAGTLRARARLSGWSVLGSKRLACFEHDSSGNELSGRTATVVLSLDARDSSGRRTVLATSPDSFGGNVFAGGADDQVLAHDPVDLPGLGDAMVSNVGICAAETADLDGDGTRDVLVGGSTWRGSLTGVVVAWSPAKRAPIRCFTARSVTAAAVRPASR